MVIMGQKGYTHKEFVKLVKEKNPLLTVVGNFVNTSTKILIRCQHSEREVVAWQLLKPRKHCCNKAYHAGRIPAQVKTIEDRKVELQTKFGDSLNCNNIQYNESRDKITNLKCVKHNKFFSQWVNSLNKKIGCPECGKENKRNAGIRMLDRARKQQLNLGKAKFVSKSETKWLDSLEVPVRQYWLRDVEYSVDGFDPSTNTVYLYHGKFWHGCPDTFDPEFIHPILKVKMKQLYEQTIIWEDKIKSAGYNLIVRWGK
jgi:hypothetical protein